MTTMYVHYILYFYVLYLYKNSKSRIADVYIHTYIPYRLKRDGKKRKKKKKTTNEGDYEFPLYLVLQES